MDVTNSAQGLVEELTELIEAQDFEGGEELLLRALGLVEQGSPYQAFLNFQMGKVYTRWDKLTSALNHLNLAAEQAFASRDEFFLLQIQEELRLVKDRQFRQRP